MKKPFFTILLLSVICSVANAQGVRSGFSSFMYENAYKLGTMYVSPDAKKNGIKQVEYKRIDKKKNIERISFITRFNNYGAEAGYDLLDKKGKIKYSTTYNYIDSTHYDKVTSTSKKGTSVMELKFDDRKNLIKVSSTKNGKPAKTSTEYTYNSNNLNTKTEMYSKGVKKYTWEYDYFENGDKKQTRLYNAKGKIESIWNYSCSPLGEQQKKVIEINYCKKENIQSDGSYYITYEGSDSKGHTMRSVKKYSKDNLLLEERNYNIKGKETFSYINEYNNDRQPFKVTYLRKGKPVEIYYHVYNDKGMLSSWTLTNNKGREVSSTEYIYTYY